MILFELTETEEDSTYKELAASNGMRQYHFLSSIVTASLAIDKPFLSTQIIKALNYHAIACLHTNAGEFRPCEVTVGSHTPPAHFRVQALMDDLVNHINRVWAETDAVVLATFALWRLNWIHPFINGNGRTARASCYFILCLKAGGLLHGNIILPELIRQNRGEYVAALEHADKTHAAGALDLDLLHSLIVRLVGEQLATAPPSES